MKKEEIKHAGAVFFFSFIIIYTFFIPKYTYAQAFKRFKEGDMIKPIVLKTIDQKEIDIETYKNKYFLGITFWKYPSERSISALKFIQKMNDIYSNNYNLLFISIYCPKQPEGITQQEIDDIEKVLKENKITIPVLLDNGLSIFSSFGVISLPSSTLLSIEGKSEYILAGFPKFGAERDFHANIKKILQIPVEIEKKIKYEPNDNAGRQFKLANAVLARGNTDKAISYLKKAIDLDPKYSEPYKLLGKLYALKQNKEEAIEYYRKSLELEPDNDELLIKYSFLCLELDLLNDALLTFKNVIQTAPEHAATGHYGLGTIFLKNEVYDSAKTESEKARKLFEEAKSLDIVEKFYQAQNIANLAKIYTHFNDKKSAINAYKEAQLNYNEIITEILNSMKFEINEE